VVQPSVKVVVRDVGKVFSTRGGPVEALSGITLDVRDGEFLCLLGPSGCGKTTLLRVLAELARPSSGEVRLRHDDPKRTLSAVVFQDYSVFPWKTIRDNVMFPLLQAGTRRAAARATADRWLAQLDLTGFEKAYPETVSGESPSPARSPSSRSCC